MSMNKELLKKEIRRRASKFVGTSIADSFTVSKRENLLIWTSKEMLIKKMLQSSKNMKE